MQGRGIPSREVLESLVGQNIENPIGIDKQAEGEARSSDHTVGGSGRRNVAGQGNVWSKTFPRPKRLFFHIFRQHRNDAPHDRQDHVDQQGFFHRQKSVRLHPRPPNHRQGCGCNAQG